MRTGLLILCAFIFLAGCGGKDKIPNGILPQKKMQAVMWDMMRADQFLSDYVLNKDSSLNRKTESIKIYQKIFLIHKINKEVFQRSFSFYQSHPALLKVIMDSLSKIPETITSDTVKPMPVKDTLQQKKDTTVKDTTRPLKKIKRFRRIKKKIPR
jgi:hypothetical protein